MPGPARVLALGPRVEHVDVQPSDVIARRARQNLHATTPEVVERVLPGEDAAIRLGEAAGGEVVALARRLGRKMTVEQEPRKAG